MKSDEKGRVTGIGGFFFRAKHPDKLAKWYDSMLGVQLAPTTYDESPWRTASGTTVFKPFNENTTYFGNSQSEWMINFRVDNMDAIVGRLTSAGYPVEYEGNGEAFPNGKFAQLLDPEGNAIQLWEPGGVDPG